ncbi:MAG: regulatory protein RecX [Dehalococcoidia bacterium]|nr:regulatory protein RecX [Dehalococcoidia bacterium]
MPTVTALKRGRGNRFMVYLDGHFAFALRAEAAVGLAVGNEISGAEIDALLESNLAHRCHVAALRLLTYRPWSRAEMQQGLLRRGFPVTAVMEELERLALQGLVDDIAFARMWRDSRETTSPRSARLIQGELRRKGVDSKTAADAIWGLDDEAAAYRAGLKKVSRWSSLGYPAFRRRVGGFLGRRGFSHEVVRRTVDRLWQAAHLPSQE